MAKKNILVDIDFNQNQLLNPVLQNLPEDPSTGVEGQKYFNTTNHIERTYRNGAWQNTTDEYELPAASTNTRGGIKVGSRLYIENEDVLNVHRASKVIEGIGRFATDAEVEAGTQPNVAIDPVQLKSVIDSLPTPMQFKGTLGSGGTITILPTASVDNAGFVYLVISDGTYDSQVAKAGDEFICAKPVGASSYEWILVPSGDEPAQIQADWNQTNTTALDYIKNKPNYSLSAWLMSFNSTSSTIILNFGIGKIPSLTNKVVYIFARFFSLTSIRDTENNKNVQISFWDDNNGYIDLPLKIAYAPNYDTLNNVKLYQLPEFTAGTSGTLILMYDPQNSCIQYLGGIPDFSAYYNDGQITDFLNVKGGFSVPTRTYYGTCSTAASTATKVLTFSDCRLVSGVIIGVLFSNTNTAQNPTLSYDSQVKSIKYNGSILSTSNLDKAGKAGHVTYYMYDGTNWIWMGEDNTFSGSFNDLTNVPDATETQKGVAELATSAEAEAGTDTERVLTPKTNRDAHDAWHWFGTQAEFDALAPDYDPNVIYHVENTEDTGITLHWTDDVSTLASNNQLVTGDMYAKLPTGDTDKRNITNLYMATSSSTYITLWNL